jgi:hypothetical protein
MGLYSKRKFTDKTTRFAACIDDDGKIKKGYIFEKEAFLAWLDTDGKVLKDKCFEANNGFKDEK